MATPLKVLMLEDRKDDAMVILQVLKEAGFDPVWERVEDKDGFEAELDPSFDLILADFRLPQWSGLEALEIVKSRGIDVPLILVSGTIGEDLAVEAMRRGAADYILKDRPARLGSTVRIQLEAKRLRDEKRAAEAARAAERLRAEEALRESEERYRTLVEGAEEIIFTVAPEGMLTSLNRAFERVSGWRAEEWVGRHFIDLIAVTGREQVAEFWERLLGGEPVTGAICRS